jgi:hypothetical protein
MFAEALTFCLFCLCPFPYTCASSGFWALLLFCYPNSSTLKNIVLSVCYWNIRAFVLPPTSKGICFPTVPGLIPRDANN